MGTQFTSRLSGSDTDKVRSRVQTVWNTVAPDIATVSTEALGRLSAEDQRTISDAAVAQLFLVAEERQFFKDFCHSDSFVLVLDWLKELRNDADYKGFQGAISRYQLAKDPNPMATLARELRGITDAKVMRKDAFRVSVRVAATGVLAEVATRDANGAGDSRAVRLGRQMATLALHDVVSLYVRGFMIHFLDGMMSRANPEHEQRVLSATQTLIPGSAQRIARAATRRITKEGEMHDSHRILRIVCEELRDRTDRYRGLAA